MYIYPKIFTTQILDKLYTCARLTMEENVGRVTLSIIFILSGIKEKTYSISLTKKNNNPVIIINTD